jgi:glucans biosynthesis protein
MNGRHKRNTSGMLASPRCGAKTRKGPPCRAPAVAGKARCRMHGGAPGSGAPKGNRNALKHGLYTREAIEERRLLRAFIREAGAFMKEHKE